MTVYEKYGDLMALQGAANLIEGFAAHVFPYITPEDEAALKHPLDRGLSEFIKSQQDKLNSFMALEV